MTFQNLILIISLTFILPSCKTANETKFSITKIDTLNKPIVISIDDLTKNYKKLHGQFVETSGRYYLSDENFSISTDIDTLTGKVKRFWLHVDHRLKMKSKSFDKMNGMKIKVKGIVDTTQRGHMKLYLATISRIYFWELHN